MYHISTTDSRTLLGFEDAVTLKNHSHVQQATFHGDVVFGSPKDDCRGTGICKIISGAEFPDLKRSCSRTKVQFQCLVEGEALKVTFENRNLCANLMRHYFSKTNLEIPMALAVSPILASVMGLNLTMIQAGIYPILLEKNGYSVTFRLV